MASDAGLAGPFVHTCSFCSLIEAGQLEEVRKLIQAEQDGCQCWAQQAVYRVVRFYQRFLRQSRTDDSLPKALVWKSAPAYRSATRALVLEVCAKLLAGGAPINYTTGVETPLMAALSTCDEDLLWLLLDFKADVNQCDGVEDINALGLAILLNEVTLVEILLKHGAKVNCVCCGNLVPIQLAMNKNAAVSNLLIQYGADVHQLRSVSLDDRLFTSQSPLHVAILRKNVHLGRLLLEHGEDVNQTFNDTLESPIHQAVRNLDLDMIDLLLEYGADLNRPDSERHTPMGLALMIEDPVATAIAKKLILAGASANQKTGISYFQKIYSPLHIACFKGNLDFVRFLVEEVCTRIGFWDEEMEASSAEVESEGKGAWGRSSSEKGYSSTKGSQECYFKLLRRNERFWGSTPSSSENVSVRQGPSTPSTSTFQADGQDYHVRSEQSSSPRNKSSTASKDAGKSATTLRDKASRRVGSASALAAGSGVDRARARSGSICNGCRERRDSLGASGGAAPSVLPTPSASGGQDKEDAEESQSIVFVVGGEAIEKPTVTDNWIVHYEGNTQCDCCEFCLSPDVLSSSSIVICTQGTQTDRVKDKDFNMALFTSPSSSNPGPSGSDRKRSGLARTQSLINFDALEITEGDDDEESEMVTVSDDDDDDDVEYQAFYVNQEGKVLIRNIRNASTQTYIRAQPLTHHQAAAPAAAGLPEAAATAVETGATASESPVFQKEFGAPDYDFPPQAERWQGKKKEAGGGGGGKSHSVARFLNQVGNDGSTALFMAVYDGNVELVDYLLRNGADPYFSSQHGNFFHAAVLSQSVPLLQRALELRCNINEVNMFGNSPLTLLSRLDLADACEVLVSHGADMNSRDRYGETPLLASVYFGCEMNARTLIQHGAALDLMDENHTSAIYWSIFNNRQRTLKLLLMAGATFTPQVFRQYPRNIRVMNNRPLFLFIYLHVHQPRSLQDLTTIRIRTHLGRVRRGRSILKAVDLLPLPNRLKDVLRLKHFFEIIDSEVEQPTLAT